VSHHKHILDLKFFNYVIDTLADPVFVKDEDHLWVVMNDALCNFIGIPREKLIGKSDFDYFAKEEAEIFWQKDDEVFRTEEENINEEVITDAKGKTHTISTKKSIFKHPDTGHKYLVGVIRDITQTKTTEKKLQQLTKEMKELAVTDEMTGLANRRQLFAIAEHVLLMAKRNKQSVIMLFVDMNKLKQINDKYGHIEGDRSIIEVANILKDTLRESDVVARLGGDEFVVLLSAESSDYGEKAIKRLKHAISERNLKQDILCKLSLSIGYAYAAYDDNLSIHDLIKISDKSMYEQKKTFSDKD
jgi:diguanylate cyclase (GGDEF)-like protein/PAS domain S-box-containing protein